MDAEEGGALAAARAPLVQESDPQSPGSPFSRLLATTSRVEDDIYRTASATEVLRDFGGVFKDQYEFLRSGDAEADAAAEGFYGRSAVHAQWPGSMFCYRGLGRGDVWAAGCVAWFYVLVAVNVKLFSARPRTRLGRRPAMRPPTRAVSSIRSPRGDGVGPQLTFFPSMPTAAPSSS